MKAKLLFFSAILGGFISCQQTSSKEGSQPEAKIDSMHNAKNSLDYIGMYKGILPCADCEGLETTVTINENNTYNIKTHYLGKGNKIFEQKGTFSWNKAGNTIVLEGVDYGPNRYFVSENKITQLDLSGQKITGELASHYVLSKQPATANPAIENMHEHKDTVDLNSRIEAQTVIKKVNPAIGKVALAETKWKLMTLNGKVVAQNGKKDYFIKLNSADGRFAAYAGCNNFSGNYAMPSAFEIAFMNTISTKMACPNMALENRFASMLQAVDRYTLKDNILSLKQGKQKVLATFEPSK